MNQKLNLHQRMLMVMTDLSTIAKGDKMVNGQYRFVSHDAVTKKIHPLLVKHGLLAIPSVVEMKQDGNRTTVTISVSFINVDLPSDNLSIMSVGYGIDASDKGPGKAISYAFKYALLKAFCLETGDDPDNDAKAAYAPLKCVEFDFAIPVEFNDEERSDLHKFLMHSCESMEKNIEDVKRAALKRMPEFLSAFKNWKISNNHFVK